jgi:lipopolysaccharide transport system permease protein
MNEIISGFNDFIKALRRPDLWLYMAFFDVRMKYRRSYIGPWWETVSSALIIAVLGFLWSKIFALDIIVYLPYFAIGFIVWSFIVSQINEACEIFYLHQNIILNIKIPYHSLLLRLAFKNGLILMHSLMVLIPIIIYTIGLKLIFLYSFL